MATSTTTTVKEYDDEGRIVKETVTTETQENRNQYGTGYGTGYGPYWSTSLRFLSTPTVIC